MLISPLQSLKARAPIDIMSLPIVTLLSVRQPSNAELAIVLVLSLILHDVIFKRRFGNRRRGHIALRRVIGNGFVNRK